MYTGVNNILHSRLNTLSGFLAALPGVRSLTLYGSLADNRGDEYSDIDMALDVSGTDNGVFLLELPEMLARQYPVLYTDFAPSLAPEKYILTAAVYPDNPFLLLDISVTASPHCTAVTREMLAERNRLYTHTLKLFTANLKHSLRGLDCTGDIRKMVRRLPSPPPTDNMQVLLQYTHDWLTEHAEGDFVPYLLHFSPVMNTLR